MNAMNVHPSQPATQHSIASLGHHRVQAEAASLHHDEGRARGIAAASTTSTARSMVLAGGLMLKLKVPIGRPDGPCRPCALSRQVFIGELV